MGARARADEGNYDYGAVGGSTGKMPVVPVWNDAKKAAEKAQREKPQQNNRSAR